MADDPDFSPVLRRNAQWADTFGGSSTNLAQRQRYAQDKEMYAQDLLQQQEAQAENLARTDRVAQDFYFRQKDLGRKTEMDKFTRTLRDREQERKDSMLPLQMDTEKARADAQDAMTLSRLNKEKRDARNALRVAQDTDAFEAKVDQMMESGVRPGSKQFAENLLDIVATHPYVPADLRKTWIAQAGVDVDPETFLRDTAELRTQNNMRASLSRDANGKWKVGLVENVPKADKSEKSDSFDAFNKDLEAAKKAYNQQLPDFIQKAFEERGRKIGESVKGTTASPTVPASPNQAATKWLQDNPDDPRAPAIRAKLGM